MQNLIDNRIAAIVLLFTSTLSFLSLAAIDATKPLGDAKNPVRACGSEGQKEYLGRLQCANGETPTFSRKGGFGRGPYGSIIDGYDVACGSTQREVFMDMYHCNYRETRPLDGLAILPELPARLAKGCPPEVPSQHGKEYVFYWREVEFPAKWPDGLRRPPKLQNVGTGGWTFINGVIGRNGKFEADGLTVTANDADRNLQPIVEFVKTLTFEPALHHIGCPVRERVDIRVEFPPE